MRSNNVKDSRNRVFFLAIFFVFVFYSSMKILSINTSFPQRTKNYDKTNKTDFSCLSSVMKQNDIPTFAIKANFVPNFGKYKKVANITLTNKDTEMPVIATLRKAHTGDFVSFQISTKRNHEDGFLHMNLSPIPTRGEFKPKNRNGESIPEVTHLKSISGETYRGIGTSLINAAINESLRAGKKGELFLKAETGYGSFYSDYRKDDSPIPFYYKMGFQAVDPKIHSLIKECIKKADYDKLPPSALLILTEDAVKAKNFQFSKDYRFD